MYISIQATQKQYLDIAFASLEASLLGTTSQETMKWKISALFISVGDLGGAACYCILLRGSKRARTHKKRLEKSSHGW